MKYGRWSLLLAVILLCSCSRVNDPLEETTVPLADDKDGLPPLRDDYKTAQLYWTGDVGEYTLGLNKVAKHDIWCTGSHKLYAMAEYDHLVSDVRALNPDEVFLGYYALHTLIGYIVQNYRDGLPVPDLYHDLIHDLEIMGPYRDSYLVKTVEGDTFYSWNNSPEINILIPAVRAIEVHTLYKYWIDSNNRGTDVGLFLDWFCWTLPEWSTTHDPDLDLDGIPHAQDPDEQEAFRQAERDLLVMYRAVFGPDCLILGNGQMAREDEFIMERLDGHLIERAGQYGYPNGVMDLLSPTYPKSLWNLPQYYRHQLRDPILIVDQLVYPQYVMPIAKLAEVYGSVNTPYERDYQDPDPALDLGAPSGPMLIFGTKYFRVFQRGILVLSMTGGDYPQPFTWQVREK